MNYSSDRNYRQELKFASSSFLDAETLASLEPSLNNHFLGSQDKSINNSNLKKSCEHKLRSVDHVNGVKMETKKVSRPPPLPSTASSSDIYTKKIEDFKRKLKTFRNNGNNNIKQSVEVTRSFQHKNSNEGGTIIKSQKKNNKDDNNNNNRDRNNDHLLISTPKSITTSLSSKLSFDTCAVSEPITNRSPSGSNFSDNSMDNIFSMPIRRKRADLDSKCILCDLKLDTTFNLESNERVIQLKCEHFVHEQCLLLEMDFNKSLNHKGDSNSKDNLLFFPNCSKCLDNTKAIPKDPKIFDEIYTEILILSSPDYRPKHDDILTPSTPAFQSISLVPASDTVQSPNLKVPARPSKRDIKNNKILTGQLTTPQLPQLVASNVKKHLKKSSRGSSISATASIISSVSDSALFENMKGMALWTNDFPIDLLRSKFTHEIIQMSAQEVIKSMDGSDIKLHQSLLQSFGNLRLVDKLSVSRNNQKNDALENYCFLFQHMLLILEFESLEFNLISINYLTFIDTSNKKTIILKANKRSNESLYISSSQPGVLDKWTSAINNLKSEFENYLITSTLKEDEFDNLFDTVEYDDQDNKSIFSLQKAASDGLKALAAGVNPRFYESTINSLIFKAKPSKIIIVLNQLRPAPGSSIAIKNIIKSLLLIKIDMFLVFCSTDDLTLDSHVLGSHEINKDFKIEEEEIFMERIDQYQENLVARPSYFKDVKHENTSLNTVLQKYIDKIPNNDSLGTVTSVIMSNTSLKNMNNIPSLNNIPIEIGLNAEKKSNRLSVADLADWEDVMEVICNVCGLEFDESDFEFSSDDEDENENENEDEDDEEEEEGHVITLKPAKGRGITFELTTDNEDKEDCSKMGPSKSSMRWNKLFGKLDKALEETKIYLNE